jgi:hypothetical protein
MRGGRLRCVADGTMGAMDRSRRATTTVPYSWWWEQQQQWRRQRRRQQNAQPRPYWSPLAVACLLCFILVPSTECLVVLCTSHYC